MPGSVKGKVIDVRSHGGLVTDITAAQLQSAPRDASVHITVDEHETFGLFTTEHGQPAMTLVAIVDAGDGSLVIELVGDSASDMLGVRSGAPVEVRW